MKSRGTHRFAAFLIGTLAMLSTIFVPSMDTAAVTESDKPANAAEGVTFLRMQDDAALHAVDSGTYRFQAAIQETIR